MTLNEVAPPTKKHERMVKHIKKAYKKDGKLTDDEKSIAYATAWKNYNKKEVKEASAVLDVNTKISQDEKKKKKEAELKRLLKHAIAVKKGHAESFEIDKSAHKKVQKQKKMRNLAIKNTNKNEGDVAHKKAGGPKLYGEEVSRRNKPSAVAKKKKLEKLLIDKEVSKIQKEEMTYQEAIDAGWEMTGEGIWWPPQNTETVSEKINFKKFRNILKKKDEKKKPTMDSTTRKLHKWRTDKEQEEREKYVTFTKPVEDD